MAPETIYRSAFIPFLIILVIIRVYYHRKAGAAHSPRARSRESLAAILLMVCSGTPGIAALALWLVDPRLSAWNQITLPAAARWAGIALFPFALALLGWVHHTLDTNFSPTLKLARQHRLVTSGPYRRIRHPMYTALFLNALAIFLISGSAIIGLVTMPCMTLAMILRIPREEAMMLEWFGEEYRRYMRQTGSLFPAWNR